MSNYKQFQQNILYFSQSYCGSYFILSVWCAWMRDTRSEPSLWSLAENLKAEA